MLYAIVKWVTIITFIIAGCVVLYNKYWLNVPWEHQARQGLEDETGRLARHALRVGAQTATRVAAAAVKAAGTSSD